MGRLFYHHPQFQRAHPACSPFKSPTWSSLRPPWVHVPCRLSWALGNFPHSTSCFRRRLSHDLSTELERGEDQQPPFLSGGLSSSCWCGFLGHIFRFQSCQRQRWLFGRQDIGIIPLHIFYLSLFGYHLFPFCFGCIGHVYVYIGEIIAHRGVRFYMGRKRLRRWFMFRLRGSQ